MSFNNYYQNCVLALNTILENKATARQWKSQMLSKGAKIHELNWMGFDQHFSDESMVYSKNELLLWANENKVQLTEHVKAFENLNITSNASNTNESLYFKYQLYSGQNYREYLLCLNSNKNLYFSSHWEESNVIAHFRSNDQIDSNGQNILFIEELQSDWSQSLRKDASIIHNSPFEKTSDWLGLCLRRIIHLAASKGYAAVAWAPGSVQTERYFPFGMPKEIYYFPLPGEGHQIEITTTDKSFILQTNRVGIINFTNNDSLHRIEGCHLSLFFSSSQTNKIISSSLPTTITFPLVSKAKGGLTSFYDSLLPLVVQNNIKKWGGGVNYFKIDLYPHLTPEGINLQTGEFETSLPKDKYLTCQGFEVNNSMKLSVPSRGVAVFEPSPIYETKNFQIGEYVSFLINDNFYLNKYDAKTQAVVHGRIESVILDKLIINSSCGLFVREKTSHDIKKSSLKNFQDFTSKYTKLKHQYAHESVPEFKSSNSNNPIKPENQNKLFYER